MELAGTQTATVEEAMDTLATVLVADGEIVRNSQKRKNKNC